MKWWGQVHISQRYATMIASHVLEKYFIKELHCYFARTKYFIYRHESNS